MRVKLTDQALVAVALARRGAEAAGRSAHVADLLVGLGAEADGVAGRLLGEHASALTALAGRLAVAPPRLPALEVALRWAAGDVGPRPLGTIDLLLAAIEVGGSDLADLLDGCGLPRAALAGAQRPAATPLWAAPDSHALTETYGLDPSATDLTPAAARAVARTRAVGGGAVTLVAALAGEASTDPDAVPLDPDALRERLHRLAPRGAPAQALERRGDDDWDAGVEAVLEGAWRTRHGDGPLGPVDLLRAAALVGGRGPARLLALPPERP